MLESMVHKKVVDDGTHKDPIVRLHEREEARRAAFRQEDVEKMKREGITQTKTKKQLEADRRAATAMEVAVKGDKPRAGVHPGLLPLFSQSNPALPKAEAVGRAKGAKSTLPSPIEDRRKYREFRAGYLPKPAQQSRIQYLQDQKYWAKNDVLLLGDLTLEENPQTDSFKKERVKKPPPKEVTEKALSQNFFPPGAPTKAPHTTTWRFTEVALKTSKIKGRLFDHIPKAADSAYDFDPLFSSFADDKQFRAPVSSKEMLQRKLLRKQQGNLGGAEPRERSTIAKM